MTTLTLDNDLLTLWLRAGDLNCDEVRDLIDRLQDDVENARDDAQQDTAMAIAMLEKECGDANDRIAKLEAEILTLRGQ